jgi:hypothetical protein
MVPATDGTPLGGVTVRLAGSLRYVETDSAGRFVLHSASAGIVEFSSPGRRPIQQCLEGRTNVDVVMELDPRGWWGRLRAGSPVRVAVGERIVEGDFTQLQNERLLVATPASTDSIPIRRVNALWQRGPATERGARIGGALGAVSLSLLAYGQTRSECDDRSCTTLGVAAYMVSASFLGATVGALSGAFVGRSFRSWTRVHP